MVLTLHERIVKPLTIPNLGTFVLLVLQSLLTSNSQPVAEEWNTFVESVNLTTIGDS